MLSKTAAKITATRKAIWRFVRGIFVKKPTIFFLSDFDLEESVRRLQEAVVQETFWGLLTMKIKDNCPVGTVTKNKVILLWYRPFFYNSFAPRFVGRFTQDERGKVVLIGRFSPQIRTIVLTPFIIFIALFSLFPLLFANRPTLWHEMEPALLHLLGIVFFVIVLFFFGSWLARNEQNLISDFVRKTLLPQYNMLK